MITAERQAWLEANQRYLTASLAALRATLVAAASGPGQTAQASDSETHAIEDELRRCSEALLEPSALDFVCAALGLSLFERELLLLCAGVELDSSFAEACAAAQGDRRRTFPTFNLALAALPDPHWSATTPAAALRRWRLIEIAPGESLTTSPLKIDEPILHYLTGLPYADDRLLGYLKPLSLPPALPPSSSTLIQRIERLWSPRAAGGNHPAPPVVQLCGAGHRGQRMVAASACAALGLRLRVMRAADVPTPIAEREALVRLWDRAALFTSSALLLDCDDTDIAERARHVVPFIEASQGLVMVASREPLRLERRSTARIDVPRPTVAEQHAMWTEVLGALGHPVDDEIRAVASHFQFDLHDIQEIGANVVHARHSLPISADAGIWDACRVRSRARLDDLAQRIESTYTWDHLVLPDLQQRTLIDIVAQVRHRFTVYETWGFAERGERGLGMSALFAGPSGTGKTMAAEVLANELRLDLYRIDLSQVVSKYIGETERNLRRVFDASEEGGAVLLFDEADALFGKRSEVKDSHDRYANIEVSYLLQRMESYRGLAILATNMKSALDPAFLRRIRFTVQFPFPELAQRMEIWRRMFPAATPTEGLDVVRLARLNVTGGTIRNIALNAAFRAADEGTPVRMANLLHAARSEYAKLEKPLTDQETAGWR